jgi:hypothetical protein
MLTWESWILESRPATPVASEPSVMILNHPPKSNGKMGEVKKYLKLPANHDE